MTHPNRVLSAFAPNHAALWLLIGSALLCASALIGFV